MFSNREIRLPAQKASRWVLHTHRVATRVRTRRRDLGTLRGVRALATFCVSVLIMLAATSSARANGRFPQSNQITMHPLNADVIVARTTFGLLVSDDHGANFHWICEQVLGTRLQEDPALTITEDRSTLVSLYAGQRRGAPDRCSWEFVSPALTGLAMADSIGVPGDARSAFVISSHTVFKTLDNGVSFAQVGDMLSDVALETIEVAPSRPARMYLSGAIPPTSSTPRQAFVFRSDDAGETWERFPFALGTGAQSDFNIYLAAVDPTNEARVYMRVLGAPNDRLVVSDDAGESFHEVLAIPSMRAFARSDDGGTIWAGSDTGALYRSQDRGEMFEPLSGLHANCLYARGTELWACGNNYTDGFVIGRSSDGGETFDAMLTLAGVQAGPTCASGTPLQTVCGPMYDGLTTLFRPDAGIEDAGDPILDADVMDATVPTGEPTGCACSTNGNAPASVGTWGVLLFALFVLARARGRDRSRSQARRC